MNELGIAGEQLDALFPFLVAFDDGLRIVRVGPSLARACPGTVPGRSMADCFRILRPPLPQALADIRANVRSIFVAEDVAGGLRLRGQMVLLESGGLFLATPWIQEIAALERFGLSIDDFAIHDATTDYLFLLQGTAAALQEATTLSERLTARQLELRQTVEALTEAAGQHADAQRALEASEANLRAILESAADGIVTIDTGGVIKTFNAAAGRIFGWPPQEIIGRNVNVLVPPPHQDQHDAYVARYLASGEPRIIGIGREVEGLRKDGSRFPMHLSVSEISTNEGKLFTGIIRDLTGLKEAQQARADSEAQTRLIVDTALDAVIAIDGTGRVTTWNRQAEQLFGWQREEAVGRELSELIIPPHLREAHHRGMRHYLATGEGPVLNRRIEVPAQDRHGRQFPVELAISPLQLGSRLSFSAFVRDISARKRSEQLSGTLYRVTRLFSEASTLEQVTRPLLEAACKLLGWDLGALWIFEDGAERLRWVDDWCKPELQPAAFLEQTRTLAFAPGEGLPGRVFSSGEPVLIPRVQESQNFPRARAAALGGITSGVALPVLTGGTAVGVLEFFSCELREPDAGSMETLTNIASQLGQFVERRRAGEALALSESRMRAVIDHMLEGLVIADQHRRILSANAALARMFGYEQHELVGMSVLELTPPTEEYLDPEQWAHGYRQGLGRATQREARRKGGEIFPVETQLYEIPAGDDVLTVCHVRDLSQQQVADRLKKQFVAAVSHELRTPLTSIRGSLGLLATGAVGQLPADALRIVEMAERNTVRLVGLINDILDFERLESGRISLSRSVFPLQRAIERALEALAVLAEQSHITIAVAGSAPVQVDADEARIVQVLVNLLSNAIKFSPKGSQVDVSIARDSGMAEVRVRDRGRGVPEALRAVIFDPFRQVEADDARQRGGAGLGLSICRLIVRQHGGEIGVERPDDLGSVFWFTVPLASATSARSGDGHP